LAYQSLQENQQTLSPETWSALAMSAQWQGALEPQSTGEYASVIRLQGHLSEATIRQLQADRPPLITILTMLTRSLALARPCLNTAPRLQSGCSLLMAS